MKTIFKPNKFRVLITLIIFLTILLSNHFFYQHIPYEHYLYPFNINHFYLKLFFLRILDLILIYSIICIITSIIQNFKRQNMKHRLFLESFIITAIFLLIGFIKKSPGIWEYDTLHILEYASTLETIPWHNIYTSIFYIISLSIIPHPIGIILFQSLIINIILSYIYSNIFSKYPTKLRFITFLFLLTPINQFYCNWCFRTTLSSYLELFIIFFTIFHIKENKIYPIKFILYCLIVSFVISYRSENIFYIILPFLLITKSKKETCKIALIIILFTIFINMPQKIVTNKYYKSDYLIITTFEPMQYILNSLPEQNELINQEKDNIEKIIPLDYIKNYGQHSYFEYNYEQNKYATVANKSNQKEYLQSAYKLFFKNYKLFLKNKINAFTNLIINKTYFDTSPLYSIREKYFFEEQYKNLIDYSSQKYNIKSKITTLNTNYKLIIPLCISLISAIISMFLLQKQFWIYLTILIKIPIIILFAPGCSFMYFYYIYISSYIVLTYSLAKIIYKKKEKNHITTM